MTNGGTINMSNETVVACSNVISKNFLWEKRNITKDLNSCQWARIEPGTSIQLLCLYIPLPSPWLYWLLRTWAYLTTNIYSSYYLTSASIYSFYVLANHFLHLRSLDISHAKKKKQEAERFPSFFLVPYLADSSTLIMEAVKPRIYQWTSTWLHGVIFQRTVLLIVTVVRKPSTASTLI
jgi:hypothetical protein